MHPSFSIALKAVWLSVLMYWTWSSREQKFTVRVEPIFKRVFMYWTPLIVAVLLLGPGKWFGHSWLREQFVPHSHLVEGLGLGFCALGAVLACWSRHLLGHNWSSVVQLKEGHELIERGPYRHVRHPIYTGLLMLFLGNAVMVGDWRGLIAVAIVFASFWRKLKLEERWLGEHFGPRYADYLRRTRALVPGLF